MGNANRLRHHVETAEKTGVIQLSETNLRDIPRDLAKISHLLRTLDLSSNRLQQLNDNIATYKNLKILKLSQNKIGYIAAGISQLTKLETLMLDNNVLEALPNEFAQLSALKKLDLSHNKFSIFPSQVCRLESLEFLDLSHNEIASIPDEIGQSRASEINLSANKLTKLNDNLKNCPELKILRVDSNQIGLTSITRPILAESKICLFSTGDNPFTLKQLQERDGYDEYSERYTSTKKKIF